LRYPVFLIELACQAKNLVKYYKSLYTSSSIVRVISLVSQTVVNSGISGREFGARLVRNLKLQLQGYIRNTPVLVLLKSYLFVKCFLIRLSVCRFEKSIVPYDVKLINSLFFVQLSCALEFQYIANFVTRRRENDFYS
jgi:glucose-6-phosphate-specific signal transduction histidine kinase